MPRYLTTFYNISFADYILLFKYIQLKFHCLARCFIYDLFLAIQEIFYVFVDYAARSYESFYCQLVYSTLKILNFFNYIIFYLL